MTPTTIEACTAATTTVAVQDYEGEPDAQAVIANPPYRRILPYHNKEGRWVKGWSKMWRLGKFYLYISNCRLKKRPKRDLFYKDYVKDHCIENKNKLYERQGGKCPHCGQSFELKQLELHHVLPLSRFPELGMSIRNGILLCHQCHKEVHCNPWANIRIMEAKADEMGIDLTERYNGYEESQNRTIPRSADDDEG